MLFLHSFPTSIAHKISSINLLSIETIKNNAFLLSTAAKKTTQYIEANNPIILLDSEGRTIDFGEKWVLSDPKHANGFDSQRRRSLPMARSLSVFIQLVWIANSGALYDFDDNKDHRLTDTLLSSLIALFANAHLWRQKARDVETHALAFDCHFYFVVAGCTEAQRVRKRHWKESWRLRARSHPTFFFLASILPLFNAVFAHVDLYLLLI